MNYWNMFGSSGVMALTITLGLSSVEPARASDVLAYSCGKSPGITITINPVTGKGTFADATARGAFARAPLVPDQQGAWVNDNLGISFFPEPAASPTLSAGDAEFKCVQKDAAAPSAPSTGGGAVANYQCESIVVTINQGTGKGSFYDKSGPGDRQALARQRDGVWKDKDDAFYFDPTVSPPTFSAGDAEFKCRKAATAAAASPPSQGGGGAALNAAGLSLGGRLRDQPSMDSNSPGSLAEGAPITILSNTGVSFNGYDWFRVRTPSGMVAYQWGGIMCSKGRLLPGIYQQCM
jgi:hypothetical protein